MVPIYGFLMLSFPDMLLRYCLNDIEMVSVATVTNGINFFFFFTFHMPCFSFVSSLCSTLFSAYFLITFLSPEIAKYINVHVPLSLSWLWCPVSDCQELFCRFAIVDSIICIPYFHDLLRLILVYVHTSVYCLILSLFPCIS